MFWLLPLLGGLLTLPTMVDQGSSVLKKTFSLSLQAGLMDIHDSNLKLIRLERSSENLSLKRRLQLAVKEGETIAELVTLEVSYNLLVEEVKSESIDLISVLYEVGIKILAMYAMLRKSRSASLLALLSPILRAYDIDNYMNFILIDNKYAFTNASVIATNEEILRMVWMVASLIYGCTLLKIAIYPDKLAKQVKLQKIPANSYERTTIDKSEKKKEHSSPIPQHLNSSKSKLLKICFEADVAKLKRYIKDFRYKININQVIGKEGNTVLHVVSEHGLAEAAKVLMQQFDKKIDYDLKNKKALTALEIAIANGHYAVVNLFFRRNRISKDRNKMLALAEKSGNKSLEHLIKSFVSITENDDQPIPTIPALPYGPEIDSDSGSSDSDDSDFRCTICTKLMIKPLNIFGCTQEHLICHLCVEQMEQCPACNETFSSSPPIRRFTAEKLADLLFNNNHTSSSDSD